MSDVRRGTAAARGVCLTPGYAMAVGPFDPFAVAATTTPWEVVETWNHRVDGPCEALLSLRFAVFSRLSTQRVLREDALSESTLRTSKVAPGGGLLRAEVSVTRAQARASKTFLVGSGGIDVFGSSLRVSLLAPPGMRADGQADFPVTPRGFGVLEEVWTPLLGEDGATLRPRARVQTYCARDVRAPVPASAVHYTVLGTRPAAVTLRAGAFSVVAPTSGPVGGVESIEIDADAVVVWEVEP